MKSNELFSRAEKVIPSGVNSPVRAFGAVGGSPLYVTSGKGSHIRTVEGRELVDFCCSWGPLILGHAHPAIVDALKTAAEHGTSFGINTPREVEFAELLCELIPSMDKVRLVSSGTEATMTALRLARGFTGRTKILKFDGCYHGHGDVLLVAAGSGLLTSGIASSAGVPPGIADDVLVAPYNDLESVRRIVASCGDELAAVIVEPIAGNMGLVEPADGFLEGLRALATECGALLILDEVISGFRLAPTTYAATIGLTPDLTTLGKIIGGGAPIGALGGRADVMNCLAPAGAVYQAGTLSGNPLAVAAGLATIETLTRNNPYPAMAALTERIANGIDDALQTKGMPFHCASRGSMLTPFFCRESVANLADAKRCDLSEHARFFHAMLEGGIYLPPSQFEVAFVSAAHTEADADRFVDAASSWAHSV